MVAAASGARRRLHAAPEAPGARRRLAAAGVCQGVPLTYPFSYGSSEPAKGTIPFDANSHPGVEFIVDPYTPVIASMDGTLTWFEDAR